MKSFVALLKKRVINLNEYGLFNNDERVYVNDEEDIYKNLGLPYIIPEMREGNI